MKEILAYKTSIFALTVILEFKLSLLNVFE